MTLALDHIAIGTDAVTAVDTAALTGSHGVNGSAARMYDRFFGQSQVRMSGRTHRDMLGDALARLVARRPALTAQQGIGLYAKTQTHNTPAGDVWLRDLFDGAGLTGWDVATLSMTNCASGLAALHLLGGQDRPILLLTGEKAFHPSTSRLSVGLLGEAAAATLISPDHGRRLAESHVRHMPRFFRNPDDMDSADRRALQDQFETGLAGFLTDVLAGSDRDAPDALIVPYNLNPPLIARIAQTLGIADRMVTPPSQGTGHLFCSDIFLTLAEADLPADRRLVLVCAGMGVTFAALVLDPAMPPGTTSSTPPQPKDQ